MNVTEHLLAGRLSSPGGSGPWPTATFCTCGLAFFHHAGRDQSDALWWGHREAFASAGRYECREDGCYRTDDLRVAGPLGYRCPEHWVEP